ncbi:DUF2849 domain-containing protein [Roseibium sp. RKSG952]|uniref:DUF2849 domain-containing protein n=1 Tax=Roseibium sp. RKSG952 TaxID=2529384 RepID=UPI0012BBB9D8|nr:DUF2849 domain-containing protein [Roseibium sp. RKSG952]MTH99809.1 DUF2849 domain-containing protein [Roseibium sp. RKSG952]
MKVITANRLLDGEAVWLGANVTWVERLAFAEVYEGKEAVADALTVARQAEADQKIVGAYDMDVTVEDGVIAAKRLRERIRAAGPTTHPQLGKQSGLASA